MGAHQSLYLLVEDTRCISLETEFQSFDIMMTKVSFLVATHRASDGKGIQERAFEDYQSGEGVLLGNGGFNVSDVSMC